MPLNGVNDDDAVLACTLCRSGRQSISTLERAAQRKVEWPDVTTTPPSLKEPHIYTSIDDAFGTVMQFMNMTTRQCKRYFRCKSDHTREEDRRHCQQFHVSSQTPSQYKNPLQRPEDVKMEMAPGTYAISAGKWGAERGHTQVVHIEPGQTIDLTFGV